MHWVCAFKLYEEHNGPYGVVLCGACELVMAVLAFSCNDQFYKCLRGSEVFVDKGSMKCVMYTGRHKSKIRPTNGGQETLCFRSTAPYYVYLAVRYLIVG